MPAELAPRPDAKPRATAADGRLRVLHVQSGLQYGGIQRMLVCMAENQQLCPTLEPVFALCYREQLAAELHQIGAEVRYLGPARIREPWNLWRANRRLRELLAREPFDAVICHGSPLLAMFGSTVRRSGLPLVFWMHNDAKPTNRNYIEFMASRQRPDLVIANSRFTAASLPLLFREAPRHVVVPCPVTPPAGPGLTAAHRNELRERFDTPAESVLIVLAGRPEAWKGHALLLDALARLPSTPAWACWIIGGPLDAAQAAFLEQLRQQAATLGIADRVRFLGQRQDVPQLLAAADLFCHPNLTPEPFGIVFVEALYAGLPVISADHGGAQEIVDSTCGRLVRPNDPAALAAVLEEFIRDPELRARVSRNAPIRGAAISNPASILADTRAELVRLRRPRTISSATADPLRTAHLGSGLRASPSPRVATVRTMLGVKNLELSIKCLGSIVRFCRHPLEIVVHEDGTLDSAARDLLVEKLGRVRFQDRADSNQLVADLLRGHPRCLAFRERHIMAMQVLDIPLLTPPGERIVYTDSDILYTRPLECPQFFLGGGAPFTGSQDIRESYAVHLRHWQRLERCGVRLASRLCGGMMSFDHKAYDLDYLEWLFRLDEEQQIFSGYPFFVPQTLCAALAARVERGCVEPRECVVAHRSNLAWARHASIIHFAGYSRNHFDEIYAGIDETADEQPVRRLGIKSVPVCTFGRRILSAARSRILLREDGAGVR